MYYIEKENAVEGENLIKAKEFYYIKDTEVQNKYKLVTGDYILHKLKECEEKGEEYIYLNALSDHSFLLTRYSRPNTGVTAVLFKDKLVRNDKDIINLETIYRDKGVSVFIININEYSFPVVIERHKDSMGWNVDIHFCKKHENFVSVTDNVSMHFQSFDTRYDERNGESLIFDLVFKYDTECGVRDRKFGIVKFTKDGIFLDNDYHPLYDYNALKNGSSNISSLKNM